MRKIIFIAFLILFLGGLILVRWPIVIDTSGEYKGDFKRPECVTGEVINPFKNFDFSKGKWTAYLFIAKNEYKNLRGNHKEGAFKTTDRDVLMRMKSELRFIYTGGDMATAESEFLLYNNGKRVFESGIVLGQQKQGLQNREYGWIEVRSGDSLTRILSRFQRIYFPIIWLR